jgi:pimeloyl-ACP methyl ester carboxylesterase
MFAGIWGRLLLVVAIGLCFQTTLSSSAQSAPESPTYVKKLNFVFLHGVGSNSCSLQLLADTITDQLPAFAFIYEQNNPDTTIKMNILLRCYPGYADIDTWAQNITASINKHFAGKKDLILVGHSMGGKAALYAVAHNINDIADKTAMVVTINSPIKGLNDYYIPGGGEVVDYCRTVMQSTAEGICDSVALLDSSEDGDWVSKNKHWLAFVSAEGAPFSNQFDRAGVDLWPRDMDDGVLPISAQYSDSADVVYYGEQYHSDFGNIDEVASTIARQILLYIFGQPIECSVFSSEGNFEHRADWLLGTDYWDDVVGDTIASSGRLEHTNKYWTRWQEWEDVIGEYPTENQRSSIKVIQLSLPILTSIKEVRWFSPDNVEDSRLYINTRTAPRTTVRLDWAIYQRELLPEGTERSRYEIRVTAGTPLTAIRQASWLTDDPRDIRLRILSEAQSPFRWFEAEWKSYYTEIRQRQVISEIEAKVISYGIPSD